MKHCLSQRQELLQPYLKSIATYSIENKLTISVAESVTAGCLQLVLSTAKEAQRFFQGGITVYNCAQKAIHLNIDPVYAENCNGVDRKVTNELAKHVCKLFRSQIGVAITGYATKVPEENINKLFAHVSITKGATILYERQIDAVQEGIEAQWEYAESVIKLLSEILVDVK